MPVSKFQWIRGRNVHDCITKTALFAFTSAGYRVQPMGLAAVWGKPRKWGGKTPHFTPKWQQKPCFRGLSPLPLPRPVTTPPAPDSRAATAPLMETFASAELNQFHRQGKATGFSLGKPTPVLRPPRPDMKEKCHSWLNNSAQKIKYVAQAFERKRKSGCHAFSCPDSHALCEGCQVLLQTQFVLP